MLILMDHREIGSRNMAAAGGLFFTAAEVGGVAAAASAEIVLALRSLPEKQSAVLVLRYFLDLSEADIAQTLGIARGSVKSHASRGLAKLARLIPELQS